MGQNPGTGGPAVTDTQDPEEIQREIERTREQLGDTVEALAQKADVKAQAKQRVGQTRAAASAKKARLLGKARDASPDGAVSVASRASQRARENPAPLAVAGAFAAGLLTARVFRR